MLIRCTTKRDSEGVEIRKKVRAAHRGDLDWTVIELFPGRHDTYSPTLSWATFFMLIALSAHFGWTLSLIDVTAAFAYNQKRDDSMYIRMKSHWFRNGCKRVFEIMCTMYGLKEASLQFYRLTSGWLTANK